VLEKYRRSSDIKEARGGSLELIVASASFISSVVVPLVVMYIQKRLDNQNPGSISFEVSVKDSRVQKLLTMFADGHFGQGAQAVDRLFKELQARGYA
jgi:ABC-type tungstate transport system substrate-binding protein